MKRELIALANEGEGLSAQQIHFGSLARQDFKNGKNPPGWAVDEDLWAKAKEAASKSYSLDDDAYWPVTVSIYEKMGGTIQGESMGNDSAALVGFGNASEMDADGWAVIPYGDWKHSMGIQRFDQSSAESIVLGFKSTWAKIKRAITGLPIFNGHPDLASQYRKKLAQTTDPMMRDKLNSMIAQLENDYPDHSEYGQIADMEARPQGLAVRMVLSNAGAALVKAGKKYISPNWDARVIDWINDKIPVWSPALMNSIGLCSHPNIPVQSLVNSVASSTVKQPKENQVNKETLVKLLGLANEATEEQITAAIAELQKRPEATALANEETARKAAEGAKTALENEKTALAVKVTEAQTALANERKARIDEKIADAIRTGRITEAEKATWAGRLEKDFAAECTALANATPKVKTESEIPAMLKTLEKQMRESLPNAGHDEPDGDEMDDAKRGAKIKEMCNAEMAKLSHITNVHARYNTAFANVKRNHPELFPQLKSAAS